jgi:hypothetical protein
MAASPLWRTPQHVTGYKPCYMTASLCHIHNCPAGTELVLNSKVVKVEDGSITIAGPDGQQSSIPFGTCVWATGIAKSPLVQQLQELFPQQQMHSRYATGMSCLARFAAEAW